MRADEPALTLPAGGPSAGPSADPDEAMRAHLDRLAAGVAEAGGGPPATVELVFDAPLAEAEVAARVEAALPGSGARVASVFGGEADRFHFATFPGTAPRGREADAFALARGLGPAVGAAEANPVLDDGLDGAAAVAPGAIETLPLCETARDGGHPFGWVHPVIRTPAAWERSRGKGVTVAVIDTGWSSHRELSGVIDEGRQLNLVEGGADARDRFSGGFGRNPGHGTLVCSVVASRGDADAGGGTSGPGATTGAAPGATVMPIRAIESVISFRQVTLPKAIAFAVERDADVIVLALGGPTRVASTERALRLAATRGLVVVCAAGNCWDWVVFPAAYAPWGLCTAVAALTKSLDAWTKTCRGPEVTVAAPGEDVWGAAKDSDSDGDTGVRSAQGTTLATSLVAGVAACWVGHHGGRAALKSRADAAGTTVQAMWHHCLTRGLRPPPAWGENAGLGAGVLDAELTLSAPLPSRPPSEAMAAAPPVATERTARIALARFAARDPLAAAEFGSDVAPYAPEILWLAQRAAARARAASNGAAEAAIHPDARSAGLEAHLAGRPALRAATGGG